MCNRTGHFTHQLHVDVTVVQECQGVQSQEKTCTGSLRESLEQTCCLSPMCPLLVTEGDRNTPFTPVDLKLFPAP